MAQETSMNTRWSQIGSAIVVISYFLVWHKSWFSSDIGFKLVWSALAGLKDINGDSALLGLVMVSFILSPLVCHAINLWSTVTGDNSTPDKKKFSFIVTSIPAAIWIGVSLLLLAKSKGDPFILKMVIPHQIGGIIAMGGMALGVVFSAKNHYEATAGTILK